MQIGMVVQTAIITRVTMKKKVEKFIVPKTVHNIAHASTHAHKFSPKLLNINGQTYRKKFIMTVEHFADR